MKTIVLSFAFALISLGIVPSVMSQAIMTPQRFHEIVAEPGDNVPLQPELAAIPFWTNAQATVVITYAATGKVFRDELSPQAKTIAGKYIVFSMQSRFYHQMVHSILTYDENASALKTYGLYDDGHGNDILTDGTAVYDRKHKIYAVSSSYGDGFTEITVGSYSDNSSSSTTQVFRNGVLFLTRQTEAHPVRSATSP